LIKDGYLKDVKINRLTKCLDGWGDYKKRILTREKEIFAKREAQLRKKILKMVKRLREHIN